MDRHYGPFRYRLPTEGEGRGWHHHMGVEDDTGNFGARRARTRTGLSPERFDLLMAGVSGGQHDDSKAGAGHCDVVCGELAPRPPDIPCVSWRMLGV
jgi:hypothetical protein